MIGNPKPAAPKKRTLFHFLRVEPTASLWFGQLHDNTKNDGNHGLDGLWDIAPGRGRKPTYEIDKIAAVVDATLQTRPAGMTHWSCRTMAQSQGIGKSTVSNIWRAHKLQPHRTKTFKLSRDPKFLEKMTDVVGLYLNPPQEAVVLCVDGSHSARAAHQEGALRHDDP